MATSRAGPSTRSRTRASTCESSPLTDPVLRVVRYGDPDPQLMTAEVQAEYRRRYGGDGDTAPIDTGEFDAPDGHFVVAYVGEEPAAMGGWRRGGPVRGDAEIKRMFVRPAYQRRGLARLVLADLERTAAAAGVTRLVLETGVLQPEAISLYTSSGYEPIAPFGYYGTEAGSRHLAKTLSAERP